METPRPQQPHSTLSRRRLLIAAGGVAAAGAAGAGGLLAGGKLGNSADEASQPTVAFHGQHQAGISTPAQNFLHFAAFDITTSNRDDVIKMLKAWTEAAARMTVGDPAAVLGDSKFAPPVDTGEAIGLHAARLTITIGFGPSMFTQNGVDRFGIASRRPDALVDIPPFVRDELKAERSGGDICVQACADDTQVAFHAVRNLARIGRGTVAMRWSQLGFNRTASTSKVQDTPRNLMGFKDGTNNVKAEDETIMRDHVWVGDEGPGWMAGGSYVVARRIRMTIEHWDRTGLGLQEETIGRAKDTGAPLTGANEFDTVDLTMNDTDGKAVIPLDAHIRLAAPATNDDMHILRRGYSFTDGMDAIGELDAGLFFLAYQRDVRKQFIPLQRKLSTNDALNEYIAHTGSAIFACPPGVSEGGWLGSGLFA